MRQITQRGLARERQTETETERSYDTIASVIYVEQRRS